MTPELQQLLPRAGEVRPYRTPDRHWEEVTEEMYGSAAPVANTAFEHDPEWRRRTWSIQSAHDQSEFRSLGLWTFVGALFVTADLGWVFMRAIHR